MNNFNNELVIVDGFSLLFRNFFAMQNLYNIDGLPIGGVSGFVRTLFKVVDNFNPQYCAIALDSGKPTWRHKLYPKYKSNRKSTPEDLVPQFQIMFEACDAFGISAFKGGECEADDWIASIVNKYKNTCSKVYVCSSDKDLMQLVGGNVYFIDPFKLMIMHEHDVVQKMGVSPLQIPDLFGLIGDASDCIPGVPSIGPKTASNWINAFENIENIFENKDKLNPKSRRGKFIEFYDQAILSRTLAQLKHELTLPEISSLSYGSEEEIIHEFVHKYKMSKHIRKYPKSITTNKQSFDFIY
ncbi:hypothetical protein FZC35_01175 [Candidatus Cytomitobacter indipagum]|uniref:5'-3' exonuclease domain-containing protein n=1 Tax=Candidatus Cytomitobacter indipagum TaxID=2601575 RepID=A0A5C0UE79_9PROT|nr:5'-3' exonuclease H3TH domain-containing protein [Candidatus Cytomitobacter indipagum]QEK37991.1 hypothetical protein FZC35_01175 [Candidatus Cytomitobacter indipagum]